ncbi:ribbon-helix-helix protein, CopG family [Devosia geojensis]|nr:ribbon-helix-helix protein, CopG family [Devosia geojensis]
MQKVQVFIRADQKAALKELAARRGMRQSDLIRRSIDAFIEAESRNATDWRDVVRRTSGVWRDKSDTDELSRSLREQTKRRFKTTYGGAD